MLDADCSRCEPESVVYGITKMCSDAQRHSALVGRNQQMRIRGDVLHAVTNLCSDAQRHNALVGRNQHMRIRGDVLHAIPGFARPQRHCMLNSCLHQMCM